MKIISTVCSREKDTSPELLPAKKRYLGDHTPHVEGIAQKENAPFYILSGVYGLITGDTLIPYYDYYLAEEDIPALIEKIAAQIQEAGVTAIDLYAKEKWKPYIEAMQKAAAVASIPLTIHPLH